jgi:hypothetical protein
VLYDMADGQDEMDMLCDLARDLGHRGLFFHRLDPGEMVLFREDGGWCSDEDLDALTVWLEARHDLADHDLMPRAGARPYQPAGLQDQTGRTVLLIPPRIH